MNKIGIDLGGTNIAVGIVDEDRDRIVAKRSVPVGKCKNAEEIFDICSQTAAELIFENGFNTSDIGGIGIAVPGSADRQSGYVIYTNNLPIKDFPATEYVKKKTGIDNVYVGNDADAAAIGEFAQIKEDVSDFVMMTLGTGVGGGIIINKKLYSGFNGSGGELGHTVIVAGGAECNCGRRGCLEQYASATALIRMSEEAASKFPQSSFAKSACRYKRLNGTLDAKFPFDMQRCGDEIADGICKSFIFYLACGITNVINVFQPQILCLGGGISKEGKPLCDALTAYTEREDYARYGQKRCRIVTASLGSDAGIYGAALMNGF